MSRFAVDFAGFVLTAALVSAPACAVIHSFAREARPSGAGVHQGGGGLDAGRSDLGAQDAQPYRLTAGPHNGESLAASAGSPGFECCSRERDGVGSTRGAEQRRDLAPARCPRCDDAPARRAQTNAGRWGRTLHKGVTLGRDRGFASESPKNRRETLRDAMRFPASAERPAVHADPVARSQSVRSVPPVLSTSQSVSLLKEARAGSYLRQMATDAANLCGVPVALFHALISRESSWRPHVVSRAGAVGLAQVKPSTGREVSSTLDVREPWDNLLAGACYLRAQFDRFGTWRKALHAYRVGPNARVSIVAREYASDIIQGSAQ